MLLRYKTVLNNVETEYVEKKSRFITSVRPVKSEDDAREFVEEIKKKHWDAAHNVFAYQIGENDEIQRFSDDGEPQKTAGLPVLDVIRKEGIKNTLVVVTRYFGGTLLGTGGLVRAYTKAAKDGISAANIIEITRYAVLEVTVEYSLSGKIKYVILQSNSILKDIDYSSNVVFSVFAEADSVDNIISEIIDASSSKAFIKRSDDIYGYMLNSKFNLFL